MLKIKHIKQIVLFLLFLVTAYSLSITSLLIDLNKTSTHENSVPSVLIAVKQYDENLENSFKYWVFDTKNKIGLLP